MKSTVFVIQLYTTCLITVDLAGCTIPVDERASMLNKTTKNQENLRKLSLLQLALSVE